LKKDHYHILHIVAHGRYVENLGAAYLYLADDNHKAARVKGEDFAAMIGRQGEYVPQFVFLASCQMAKRPKDDNFQGFAPALHKTGVPAVLAMQEKIHIPTSQAFTRTFYSELFQHGQVDLACNAARSRVLTEELLGSHIPILFSRLHNNQLLVPQPGSIIVPEPFEPETICIPPGPFLMGSQEAEGIPAWETPQHEVDLPAYQIGKYPVTNEQYAAFIRQSGRIVAPQSGWEGQIPPDDKLKHPVMGVTWYDAWAYCDWLGEQTGRQYGLPSEAQWEKAARGRKGWVYPWGNEWDPSRCNHGSGQTTPVDAYPAQTVYGCYDMVGNVREWTNSLWGENPRQPRFGYPWAYDKHEDRTASRFVLRVHRGGAATDGVEQLRCSARSGYSPDRTGPPRRRHGFRVVLKI